MIKRILWLDDVRNPFDEQWRKLCDPNKVCDITWVKDYEAFINNISIFGMPDFIWFDHDLADCHYAPEEFWDDKYNDWAKSQNFKEKTGFECAKWLVEFCMDNNVNLCQYDSQSANPVGKENILSYLDNYIRFSK